MKERKVLTKILVISLIAILSLSVGCGKKKDASESSAVVNNLSDLLDDNDKQEKQSNENIETEVTLPIANETEEELSSETAKESEDAQETETTEATTEDVTTEAATTEAETTQPQTSIAQTTDSETSEAYDINDLMSETTETVVDLPIFEVEQNNTNTSSTRLGLYEQESLLAYVQDKTYYIKINNEYVPVSISDAIINNYTDTEILNYLILMQTSQDTKSISNTESRLTVSEYPVIVNNKSSGGSVVKFKSTDTGYYIIDIKRTDAFSWIALYNNNQIYALMPSEEHLTSDYERQIISELLTKDNEDITLNYIYPVSSSGVTQQTYWINYKDDFTIGSNASEYKITVKKKSSLTELTTLN